MYEVKNELCLKIMLDLLKDVTQPYNLRNGLTCASYKIKTVLYSTGTITYLSPKIWSIIPVEIRESASLEISVKKSSYGNQIVIHVASTKNKLQMLTSLIFQEFK